MRYKWILIAAAAFTIACGGVKGSRTDLGVDAARRDLLTDTAQPDTTIDQRVAVLSDGMLNICPPIKECVLAPDDEQLTSYDTSVVCTGVAKCGWFKHEHFCLCVRADYSDPNSPGTCWCFMNPGGMAFLGLGVCDIPRETRSLALAREARKISQLITDGACN